MRIGSPALVVEVGASEQRDGGQSRQSKLIVPVVKEGPVRVTFGAHGWFACMLAFGIDDCRKVGKDFGEGPHSEESSKRE